MRINGMRTSARYAPIDLIRDTISCMSLPLYLRNIFADCDHPGIGTPTDADPLTVREVRCPLSSTSRLFPSKPADRYTHSPSRVGIAGIFHDFGQYRWG